MVEPSLLEQVLSLAAEDRSELMYQLADSLASNGPISDEMKALIDERFADIAANPDHWRPAEDVERDLRAKYLA